MSSENALWEGVTSRWLISVSGTVIMDDSLNRLQHISPLLEMVFSKPYLEYKLNNKPSCCDFTSLFTQKQKAGLNLYKFSCNFCVCCSCVCACVIVCSWGVIFPIARFSVDNVEAGGKIAKRFSSLSCLKKNQFVK